METKAFGKTGYSVSPLGFGGAPVGYLKVEQDRITRILNLLLDAGVNLLDTAASYPGSEQAIANGGMSLCWFQSVAQTCRMFPGRLGHRS